MPPAFLSPPRSTCCPCAFCQGADSFSTILSGTARLFCLCPASEPPLPTAINSARTHVFEFVFVCGCVLSWQIISQSLKRFFFRCIRLAGSHSTQRLSHIYLVSAMSHQVRFYFYIYSVCHTAHTTHAPCPCRAAAQTLLGSVSLGCPKQAWALARAASDPAVQ